MRIYKNIFNKIISSENLFSAWDKFKSGKQKKQDVQHFEWRLEENIFQLHKDLKYRKYKHGAYTSFYIQDPKQRHIHKAAVRDRILHHAVFNILNPIFDPAFIPLSFSCRIGKGTHKGVNQLTSFLKKVSKNNRRACFVLKCDIKKFFETVNHQILLSIIQKRIKDREALWLIEEIIESFVAQDSNLFERRGLPIGNLTSQLFANIYLNEFDQFIKHRLKVSCYLRYTDDFIIVENSEQQIKKYILPIKKFLLENLCLELHPNKAVIRKFHQGIDFLGYICFPYYRLLRSKTQRRIYKKLRRRVQEFRNGIIPEQTLEQSLQSFLGVLSHCNSYKFRGRLRNQIWFWLTE